MEKFDNSVLESILAKLERVKKSFKKTKIDFAIEESEHDDLFNGQSIEEDSSQIIDWNTLEYEIEIIDKNSAWVDIQANVFCCTCLEIEQLTNEIKDFDDLNIDLSLPIQDQINQVKQQLVNKDLISNWHIEYYK
ncbi:hypothetical protein FOY66_01635 [Mycoplasma capricolum subsp. capripneumoniae]|uniref:Uncharacterized protein n=1 Tax=Mycoplasma capricolum subsp. capripneumoniae 87001 TaxID=1124992 RepID=A0A9N7B5W8_MYCCC|nr:hypothetical protein [Mycoplasma capricolum]AJK51343.1 hypothetical protein MCCG_0369 [Mycoplasma capricolum subsp. capripneumoniae 87001]AOQ22035.1 hypothetical protein M1601_01645 [Mycoplasma capricolum subsp. capripneumoniae M1601]AQU77434.1 hypothetical protein BVA24_01645 [Mycoplasma capricolum subsp. capripneumoniae]KEY84229.1 hypothetical protein MCCP_8500 [Mycoplasma capricolum subsp. capripneumoniae 99108]QDL19514.1 hypothetical protein DQW15_01650 [Mycoplasma capricolum subsp. cap